MAGSSSHRRPLPRHDHRSLDRRRRRARAWVLDSLAARSVLTGVGLIPQQVMARDDGAMGSASLTVTRGDGIIAWEQTLIDAIRADRNNVGLASRSMAMLSAAMYDAINDIERTFSVFKVDV